MAPPPQRQSLWAVRCNGGLLYGGPPVAPSTPRAGGAAKLFSWVKYLSAQFSVPRRSRYMNKKENLQSERDRERGGGSHRETDAELQNTPIMGRAVSLQSEQETQSDRLCGAGLRPRK